MLAVHKGFALRDLRLDLTQLVALLHFPNPLPRLVKSHAAISAVRS
jgi:hypothetical protein